MASVPIHYQPLLSPGCLTTDDQDDDNNNSGAMPHSASARRLDSSSLSSTGGGSLGRANNRGNSSAAGGGNNGNDTKQARMKRCQTAPGYVSLEDVIGADDATSFGREEEEHGGRGAWAWRPPAREGPAVISDPLVRTASRLYSLKDHHRPPRHRSQSPGPLMGRRCAVQWLLKKYVTPCLGFLAIFCGSSATARPATSARTGRQGKPTKRSA